MLKHPALRLASWNDVDAAVKATFKATCLKAQQRSSWMLGFSVVGSYARGRADLHSDIDIHVDTGLEPAESRQLVQDHAEEYRLFKVDLSKLRDQYEVIIQVSLEVPFMKDVAEKACYDILTDTLHHPESVVRVDRQPDGTYTPRPAQQHVTPPRLYIATLGSDGIVNDGADHWAAQVPKYRTMYGSKFIEIGSTEETEAYGS